MRSASYEASMTTLSLVRGQATTYTLLSMGPRVSLVTCISVPYMLACRYQPSASGSHSKEVYATTQPAPPAAWQRGPRPSSGLIPDGYGLVACGPSAHVDRSGRCSRVGGSSPGRKGR